MKKAILFLSLLLISTIAISQGIIFETGTWKEVVAKAKLANKPIFLDMYTTWCQPCKTMSTKVFTRADVGTYFNENFICYQLDAERDEGIDLAISYEVHSYPTFLFIRPNQEPCAVTRGSMDARKFIEFAKTALQSFNDPISLEVYQKAYNKRKSNPQFMILYLNKRRAFGESNDELFDEFLKMLPEQDRCSDQVVELYNAELGMMYANTFAFENLVKNKPLFEGRITGKFDNRLKDCALRTMALAQRNKDLQLLDCAILAYGADPTPANYLKDFYYMQYYQVLGDEKKFMEYASRYFNDYLVKFTPTKEMNKNIVGKLLIGGSTFVFQKITDEKILQDALSWSKRALELSPDEPNYLFACGNLLYKLGQKVEARNMVSDAINKVKDPNSATAKMYEETLRKIYAGKKTW